MKCYVAKDLLPNYIDGLNSEETNAEIKKHIAGCVDCRTIYEKMTAEVTREQPSENNDIDFLKKLKSAMMRKNAITAITTCLLVIAVLGGLLVYETSVLYDEERTKVEIVEVGTLETEYENGQWSKRTRVLDGAEPEEDEIAREELALAAYNLPHYKLYVHRRIIIRGDEQINVVYFCYTQTPFIQLLYKYMYYDKSYTGASAVTTLHGDDTEHKNIEVYYQPNLFKFYKTIEKLTNEEYDAKRTNGTLIWSGVRRGDEIISK